MVSVSHSVARDSCSIDSVSGNIPNDVAARMILICIETSPIAIRVLVDIHPIGELFESARDDAPKTEPTLDLRTE